MSFLSPLPHKEPIAEAKVSKEYKKLRLKVFAGIFLGYASYYLVRKNFSLIKPDLIEMGWDKADLGLIGAALSIAYGVSKFVMGNISDRSNPKVFLSLGLGLSSLVMLFWGLNEWVFTSLTLMVVLNFLNGWFWTKNISIDFVKHVVELHSIGVFSHQNQRLKNCFH